VERTAAAKRADRGRFVKKIIVLVEALALAAGIVAVATINPQTGQMIVAASQAANDPQESAIGKMAQWPC
jgi:hypothetical protein